MEIGITAIGVANPEYKRNQQETVDLISASINLSLAEKRLLKSVYKATGIESRHSVLSDYCKNPGEFDFFPNDQTSPFPTTAARMKIYKEQALPLAHTAIYNCFQQLPEFNPASITHLITVSCTGMYAPGIDIEIIQGLKLNPSIKRTAINFMGCYGAFNGLKVAEVICKAEPDATVLVVCVELCTIHFQNNFNLDNMISNAIFADGAAAVLVQPSPQTDKFFGLNRFYCDLLPQTQQQMAWQIADHGFDIVLSSYIPDIIQTGIAHFTQTLLDKNGWTTSQIDLYAIHPGGIKILEACETSLNITKEHNYHSYEVLRKYGNMSSATVLFVLKSIWDSLSKEDDNKNVFSCAFGPGLTLESMLLTVNCG
jgi:alpha-pyrone synthase